MTDMTLDQFEEAANLGNDLWNRNQGGRRGISIDSDAAVEVLWGAVAIDGTGGVVSSIATHTTNNFQYTSGIYGAPLPGSGDSSVTMHRFTMIFPDAQKSAKDIVPLIVQFQRCPIIPVLSAELIKEGITAVAQLQCNISTLDDTPGGIKLEFLCGEVDVSLYTAIMPSGEDTGNAAIDDVNYSLWHMTNFNLLRWFVYDFHNSSDPRFISIRENSGASIRDMMEKIESRLNISGVQDATFHLSHLSEEYLNMFATFNEVMMAIVSFMRNPVSYQSMDGDDPLEDLIDYIRNELAGSREYGAGDSAIQSMLNRVEEVIRNYFSLMIQSENPSLSGEENAAFENEIISLISEIMSMRSGFVTDPDNLSGFFEDVSADSVCNGVTLQLVNQFKPLPLSNAATQIWQYLGPGRGALAVELTTEESEIPSLGNLRNMFRSIAESIAGVEGSASAPASTAFARVITWPTILANKLYFVPDTMATSTVPGYPTLRTVSLQFSLFDGDIVERAKVHKSFDSALLSHIQVSAEALQYGIAGYGARDISHQAASGIGSFYDIYLPWFVADDMINSINAFPIELPTWSDVVGATSDGLYINHLSYDDIVSAYNNRTITSSTPEYHSPNGSDTVYIPIDAKNTSSGVATNLMGAYAPPDFWCYRNVTDVIASFSNNLPDPTMTDYGAEESENTSERLQAEAGKPKMAWSKTSPYWVDWKLEDYLEEEVYHSGKLSLIRSFPSAYFLFSSHATMGFGVFLQDMGWGYGMLEDMSIIQRGDIPVDHATIRLVNMFGKLDDPMFGGGGLIGLFLSASRGDRIRQMDAINGGMNDAFIQDLRDWWAQTGANIAEGWRSLWSWSGHWPTQAEEVEAALRKARSQTDVLPLAPGMWSHVRMGYGQPYQHATVFNGRISKYKPGDIVEIECESFGADLTKTIPAGSDDKHNCEPRKDMCRLLNKPLSGIRSFIWNISQPGNIVKEAIAAGVTGGTLGTGTGYLPIANAIGNHMISKGIPLWYATEGLGESIFTTQLATRATQGEGGDSSTGGGKYHIISGDDRTASLSSIINGSSGDPAAVGAQCEIAINMYNASPLADPGINQFGVGWADNSEDPTAGDSAGKRGAQETLSNRLATAWRGGPAVGMLGAAANATAISSLADEVSFGYSYYGRSFVDFATTCSRLTGDYIFTVVPIANRCSIYYGKPDWPVWYELKPMKPTAYNESASTAGDVVAIRRPFDQYAMHGVSDIIYNDIVAQKDFATGVKPAWSRGRPGNMADQTKGVIWEMERDMVDAFWAEDGTFSQAPVQWFDADIHPAEKRVIQEDTQILKIVGGLAPEGAGAVTSVVGIIAGLVAAVVSICTAGVTTVVAAGIALLATLAVKLVVNLLSWLWRMIDLVVEYLIGIDAEDIVAIGDRMATEATLSVFNGWDIPAGFLANMKGVYWAQVNGVAKGILKEEVETMYRGSLYVIGTPVPRPHRSQFIADPKTGMVGGFVADTVVHHLSISSGYVTEIIPKVKATTWDTSGLVRWTNHASRIIRVLSSMAVGYFVSKYTSRVSMYATAIGLGQFRNLPRDLEKVSDILESIKWNRAAEIVKDISGGKVVGAIESFGVRATNVAGGIRGGAAVADGVKVSKLIRAAEAAAFIITEAALGMFMAAWSETVDAARACFIAPITKHGRPFVAGIGGWRGSVMMEGKSMNPSSSDLSAQGQGVYGWFLKLFLGV